MKKRIIAVLALPMMIAVLAAGTAQAGTLPVQTILTNRTSADSVAVGEPVTFHITETNYEPYAISPVYTVSTFTGPVEIVSASSSQGQCSFIPGGAVYGAVTCDLGTLPPGASAYIDIVVVPQEPGILTTLTSAGLGVRGQAPDIITPITYTSVYVYPA